MHRDVSSGSTRSQLMKIYARATSLPRQQGPTIFKIPRHIRELDKSAFDPQVISIGPYHHGKPHLKVMDAHKEQYLLKFLARDPAKTLGDYTLRVEALADRAKSCYWQAEDDNLGNYDFVELLTLDCCYLLEILLLLHDYRSQRECKKRDIFDVVLDMDWVLGPLYHDLLKIENQVPFFVLESLYSDLSGPSLKELFLNFSRFYPNKLNQHARLWKREPVVVHHLLHFYHSFIKTNTFDESVDGKYKIVNLKIPSAQELVEAGVWFKSKENGYLLDVSFSNGKLEMTPLLVNEYTSEFFHNLVAFELCYPDVGNYITTYCYFIDCLVEEPSDVRLLRQEKVVMNYIGSDKEVASIFNNLCKYTNLDQLSSPKLFDDINDFHNRRWPKWRAKFFRQYVNSPWAIISLVAATVLLLLTFGQMYFAAISYVRPPKTP